jgi:hypothetical protein
MKVLQFFVINDVLNPQSKFQNLTFGEFKSGTCGKLLGKTEIRGLASLSSDM